MNTLSIWLTSALQSSTENYLLLFLFFIVAIIFFALFFYWWRGVSNEDLSEVQQAYVNQTTGPAITGREAPVYAQAEADAIADRNALLTHETVYAELTPEDAASKNVVVELDSEAVAAEPDDLKKIEGIGPKIEEVLNDAGIDSYTQLAVSNPEQLKQILADAGSNFHLADPSSWPTQAKLAADSDWTALEALQEELVGGRDE